MEICVIKLYTFSLSSFERHGFRPKKKKTHTPNISHRLNLHSVVLKSLVKGEFCLAVSVLSVPTPVWTCILLLLYNNLR